MWNTNFVGLVLPNNKAQKIVEFSFAAFLGDFLKFCPQNLQHFEDVPTN